MESPSLSVVSFGVISISAIMLQPILTPEKLWPGGIPSSVRPHPNGELTDGPEESDWKDWKEECKGWCQFVEVLFSTIMPLMTF